MSLLSRRNPETKKKWGKWISEVKAPLKAKICTWLAVEKKIVTWDRLQKCKFEEPIICLLCRECGNRPPFVSFLPLLVGGLGNHQRNAHRNQKLRRRADGGVIGGMAGRI